MTVAASKVKADHCRSCGARIVWAKMERSGKFAPFEPDADGEWIINPEGIASHQGKAPAFLKEEQIVPRYTSHFASCAHAKQWRKS